MAEPPRLSPRPPDDSAPLALEKTPAHFPVTAEYVKRKLEARDGARWQPSKSTPLWAAITIGIVGSAAAPLMLAVPSPWNAVVGSVLMGLSGALAAYYGMKSAGPKR